MRVLTALDTLCAQQFTPLHGKRLGVVCNQASVNRELRHIIDLLLPFHQSEKLKIQAVFGPQHGLWGYTQDNMIEWEGYRDGRTGIPVYSLYGKHRQPTPSMLEGIDTLVVDLPDVGARYYTFIWTLALCMEACQQKGIPLQVLDRPNPISGHLVEGGVLNPPFSSFVGLYPLPQRHGMTIGEIARYLNGEYIKQLQLEVIPMDEWKREMFFPDTTLPWAMPSPNMPSWETALVYPGMCLLEGTNISEGRGTTRPFEIFGAPWINGWRLCERLNGLGLPGVYFRPIQFQPSFHKFQGEVCEGAFLHVNNRELFRPVETAIAILQEVVRLYPKKFSWKQPPYEYELKKLPFDILAGNGWLREKIEQGVPLKEITDKFEDELREFLPVRQKYLIYD
ncbi:MAG: DUF1343 domain-containing protein [Calditrichia bacterium]